MLRNIYILVDRTSVNSISLWLFGCSLIAKKPTGFPRYVQIVLWGDTTLPVHMFTSSMPIICVPAWPTTYNVKIPRKKKKR